MTTHFLAATLAARIIFPAGQPSPDPCALVTPAEIASALGVQPSAATPEGPRVIDRGGRAWTCLRQVGQAAYLSIGFAEFPTAAAAEAGAGDVARIAGEDEDPIQLSPQAGLGDGALWGSNEGAAIWVARKGKYAINVTLVGSLGDNARLRDSFRRLAALALGRV